MAATATRETWPRVLCDLLRENRVTRFAYVPDAGHNVLIDRSRADPDVHSLPLTTEEEDPWQFAMDQAVEPIICVDNGRNGETGNQDSHTGPGVRLDIIAAGCGFPAVHVINSEAAMAEGRRLVRQGGGRTFPLPRVKEGPATHDGKKNLVPHAERDRFREALLG